MGTQWNQPPLMARPFQYGRSLVPNADAGQTWKLAGPRDFD